MKTAEEYINKYKSNLEYPSYYHECDIEEMINEARKEAIEECAKVAKSEVEYSEEYGSTSWVDKESILNLIKELK